MDIYSGSVVKFGTLTPTVSTGLAAGDFSNTGGFSANAVVLTVEAFPVRIRLDGTAPTAAIGHSLAVGSVTVISGEDAMRALRLIDTAAGASTVRFTTLQS